MNTKLIFKDKGVIDKQVESVLENGSPILEGIKGERNIYKIIQSAENKSLGKFEISKSKLQSQLNEYTQTALERYKKAGLDGKQLYDFKTEMNNIAANSYGKDDFVHNAATLVGDVLREELEVMSKGSVKNLDNLLGDLFSLKTTARIIDGTVIDVNPIIEAVGRYAGVVGGGVAGISAISSGSGLAGGGLIVAGLLSHLSGNFVANMMFHLSLH